MDKPPIKGRLENFFGKKKKGKQTTTSAADLLYLSFGWPGLGIPIPTLFFFEEIQFQLRALTIKETNSSFYNIRHRTMKLSFSVQNFIAYNISIDRNHVCSPNMVTIVSCSSITVKTLFPS